MGIFRPALLSEAEAEEVIEKKLKWILDACEPEEIWLFGSAAQQTMTVASDVDFALLFKDETELGQCRRLLYERPRPDAWPQDIAFFLTHDFHERAKIGGLPMLIVEDGRKVFSREEG